MYAKRVAPLNMRDPAIGRLFLPSPDEVHVPGGPRGLTADEANVLAALHLAGPLHPGRVHDAIRNVERADRAIERLLGAGLVTRGDGGELRLTVPEGQALAARLCELS
jgi:hypothetical protein